MVEEWEASPGTEFQAIPGIEGAMGNELTIRGVLEGGEYLGILEVREKTIAHVLGFLLYGIMLLILVLMISVTGVSLR